MTKHAASSRRRQRGIGKQTDRRGRVLHAGQAASGRGRADRLDAWRVAEASVSAASVLRQIRQAGKTMRKLNSGRTGVLRRRVVAARVDGCGLSATKCVRDVGRSVCENHQSAKQAGATSHPAISRSALASFADRRGVWRVHGSGGGRRAMGDTYLASTLRVSSLPVLLSSSVTLTYVRARVGWVAARAKGHGQGEEQ